MAGIPEIIGRQSSHFTRVPRMVAAELDVACNFTPVRDLMSRDPQVFAGNPALKLPILRTSGDTVFGSVNICRALARLAGAEDRVFWPEQSDTALLMNAHELVAHAMTAQVDVIVHEIVEKRPPDNASLKRRESLAGCLQWLDGRLDEILAALPDSDVRIFEVQLFCLLSHLPFRNPMDLSGMPKLTAFEARLGERESAKATPYRFDHEQS